MYNFILPIGSIAAQAGGIPLYAWFTQGKSWAVSGSFVTTKGA